jgi:hypothetical protein
MIIHYYGDNAFSQSGKKCSSALMHSFRISDG